MRIKGEEKWPTDTWNVKVKEGKYKLLIHFDSEERKKTSGDGVVCDEM